MITKQYEIYDKNNNKYIIREYHGGFSCKKVLPDNTLVEPTVEELQYIITELQRLKAREQTQHYDFNSLLETLKKLIDEEQLNSSDEIKKYVENLSISDEDKIKLIQEGNNYFNSKVQSQNNTPIINFKNKLIASLRKERKKETMISVSFNVIDNISGPSYCKISLDSYDNGTPTNLEMESFDYNEELKKELIEPILEEVILSQEVYPLDITPTPGGIYRSNMNLASTDNKYVSLNNIEDTYATELSDRLIPLMSEAKITDNNSRDNRLQELNMEKKNQKVRKLEKNYNSNNDKKGFSTTNMIYATISIITSLTILLQILFLK